VSDGWDELRAGAARNRRWAGEARARADEARTRSQAEGARWAEAEINAAGATARLALLREELERARQRIANLELALQTNRRIAMAVGIIMARRCVPEDEAFDVLRMTSQQTHRKLRELADEVVYTGAVPDGTAAPGAGTPQP